MYPLSNEELVSLIKDNINAKENYERLYTQNKRFIYFVIKKFGRYDQTIIDIDDMLQQAFLGLVTAVNNYDETKGCKFTTLLYFHIVKSLQQVLGYHSNISRDMREKIKRYNEICENKDRVLTDDEIMEEMKINRQQLFNIRRCMNVTVSLDEKLNDDEFTRLDLLTYDDTTQEKLEQKELRSILNEFIGELPERPKTVINKRYFRNKTINEIAEEMNLSETFVCSTERKGLNKLRINQKLRRKLEDYYVNPYVQIGVKSFQRTRTSSVEVAVLNAERYTQNWWEEYQ